MSWILSFLSGRHMTNSLKGMDMDVESFLSWCFLGYSMWAGVTTSNSSPPMGQTQGEATLSYKGWLQDKKFA